MLLSHLLPTEYRYFWSILAWFVLYGTYVILLSFELLSEVILGGLQLHHPLPHLFGLLPEHNQPNTLLLAGYGVNRTVTLAYLNY